MACNYHSIKITEDHCVICRTRLTADDDYGTVSRGLDKLVECSRKYGDTVLVKYLLAGPVVVKVHRECQRKFTNCKRKYEQFGRMTSSKNDDSALRQLKSKVLRSSTDKFEWQLHCFFCGQTAVTGEMNTKCADVCEVQTFKLRDKVLHFVLERNDSWAFAVQSRLLAVHDLVAAGAIYHKACHSKYFKLRSSDPGMKENCVRGRPVDSDKLQTFDSVCEWLESSEPNLLTLSDLVAKARELSDYEDNVYCEAWFKEKLQERYGSHLFFSEVCGRRNVLCFRKMAEHVIHKERN